MTIKPVIFIGSLIVNVGATLATSTAPAQAFIVQLNTRVPSQDIVGYTVAYTNDAGVTTNGISLSSPEFPFTSFTGNGTDTLTANFFGGAVPANTPFTLNYEIADAPESVLITTTATAFYLDNGVITSLPSFRTGTLCNTQGGGTPYLAVSVQTSLGNNIFQCQGDTVARLNLTDSDITEFLSIQPISGYQDIDTLGPFPPATAVTLRPGVLQTIPQTVTPVPEPSGILGTLAFGAISAGYLLKRQHRNKVA